MQTTEEKLAEALAINIKLNAKCDKLHNNFVNISVICGDKSELSRSQVNSVREACEHSIEIARKSV